MSITSHPTNIKYHKIRLRNEMKNMSDSERKKNGGGWEISEKYEDE